MADHAADGEQKGQGHAAHEQHGKAVHHLGAPPDADCEQQGEEQAGEQAGRRAAQYGREALLDHGTAAADVGVYQGVEHKSHGQAVERAPERAQQLTHQGVEAVSGFKMQIDFQNGLAGAKHAEPGDQQQAHGPVKPHARRNHGQGQHARADGRTGHNHGAAQNGEEAAVHACSFVVAAPSGRV